MHVDYMILADAATAVQGKHYLLGAGWDTLFTPAFPVSYPAVGVAIRLRGAPGESLQPHLLEIDVVDADERSILPAPPGPLRTTVSMEGAPVAPIAQPERTLCLAFTLLGVTFPRAGAYAVAVRVDGDLQARAPFTLALAPDAPTEGMAPPLRAMRP